MRKRGLFVKRAFNLIDAKELSVTHNNVVVVEGVEVGNCRQREDLNGFARLALEKLIILTVGVSFKYNNGKTE